MTTVLRLVQLNNLEGGSGFFASPGLALGKNVWGCWCRYILARISTNSFSVVGSLGTRDRSESLTCVIRRLLFCLNQSAQFSQNVNYSDYGFSFGFGLCCQAFTTTVKYESYYFYGNINIWLFCHKYCPWALKILFLGRFHKWMLFFMASNTSGFQISRVICAIFRQLQNMVTMRLAIFNLIIAVLANPIVALVNPLFKRDPQAEGHTSIPRKFLGQPLNFEIIHKLTLPYLILPRRAEPDRAIPSQALPLLTVPNPYHKFELGYNHASPSITAPRRAASRHAAPEPAAPRLTYPHRTMPRRTLPCQATSCHALTIKSLLNLKARYAKPPKFGAIIAYANSLARQGQNILHQGWLYLVVNYFDVKFKLPAGLKSGAYSDNAVTLNNNRTHIKVKRLVCIGIQCFGIFQAVRDFFRRDENGGLKQVFISFASLARYLEVDSSFDHGSFKMRGWLKNFIVGIYVKIFSPLFSVILGASMNMSALTHIGQIWKGETMLHQGGNAMNFNTYNVHKNLLITKVKCPARESVSVRLYGAGQNPRSQTGHFARDIYMLLNHAQAGLTTNKKGPQNVQSDSDIIAQKFF